MLSKILHQARMPKEIWKPYLKHYEVSSHGRIRNARTGRVLKQSIVHGYCRVTPSIKGTSVNLNVHQAVAEAFLGPTPRGKEVNHKNGNKAYNNIANLEYVTRQQNIQHAFDTGLGKPQRGEKNAGSKLTYRQVRRIRIRHAQGTSQSELARRYGVTQSAVQNIIEHKTWSRRRSSEAS